MGSEPRADEPDDDALMHAFAAGDARAFELLFHRHARTLLTFLAHQCGDRDAADDLLQEVFLRLVRGAREYRPGNFRAWLHTIAHNALTDRRRRAAVREAEVENAMGQHEPEDEAPLDEILAGSPETDDPLLRSHARDLRAVIEAALRRLPEKQREVFLLRERAGLDFAGIARVTGANLATVKSRMRYALAGLRRILSVELAASPETFHE
jgi:RNA polymerase sigma-70 factor (ECF subfamily)